MRTDYVCPETLALADPLALKALGMPLRRAEADSSPQATLVEKLSSPRRRILSRALKILQTFPATLDGELFRPAWLAGKRYLFAR